MNPTEPAYPKTTRLNLNELTQQGGTIESTGGFTKRELLAAMVAQGILAARSNYVPSTVAKEAVVMADALIAALQ